MEPKAWRLKVIDQTKDYAFQISIRRSLMALPIKVLSSVARTLKAKQTLDPCKRLFVVSPIKMLNDLSNIKYLRWKYVT